MGSRKWEGPVATPDGRRPWAGSEAPPEAVGTEGRWWSQGDQAQSGQVASKARGAGRELGSLPRRVLAQVSEESPEGLVLRGLGSPRQERQEGRSRGGRARGGWRGAPGSAAGPPASPSALAPQLVYPSDSRLTDKEVGPARWEQTAPRSEPALTGFHVFQKSSICYLSFPDSHSGRRLRQPPRL